MTELRAGRLLQRAWRRLSNIARYGLGPEGRARKQAAKARRRQAGFFEDERWQHDAAGSRRVYGSYEEYVQHQGAKLDELMPRLRETEDDDFAEFRRRFESCPQLREARSVLCLGARLGTEVRALHALGHFAIGIDLNPGADNRYVLPGDFHAIVFPDGSVDAVYSNALDHAFDLDKVMVEVRRLLRPGGLFVLDLLQGYDDEDGFVPGEYEAMIWRDRETFLRRIADLSGFRMDTVRELGKTRRDRWTQAVFRKPIPAAAPARVAAGAEA
jgi:SAM-dependent methyltransferase